MLFTKHGREAFSKVKGNRAYALDDRATTELASVALAYRDTVLESSGRFDLSELTKIIDELSAVLPGLKQNRPPPEPEKLTPYVDEVTGQYAKNPWSEPVDIDSQMLIAKRDPKLAEHLQAVAKGVSYSYLIKQQDEREARAKLRDLRYGQCEHENNVFRLPPGKEARAAQAEFIRTHPQHEVEWYKAEASTPVSLRFDNLTVRSVITKRSPVLASIYEKAREIHSQWLKDDIERLRQLTGEHTAQIEAAERQLAAK